MCVCVCVCVFCIIIAVYCENHMKYLSILCEKIVKDSNVKESGVYAANTVVSATHTPRCLVLVNSKVFFHPFLLARSLSSPKALISPVMSVFHPSVCPSVRMNRLCSHGTDFHETFSWRPSVQSVEVCSNRRKIPATLREDLSTFHIFDRDVCSSTTQRTHCYVSMANISVFVILLIATYAPQ
jgi:hypothetical protein